MLIDMTPTENRQVIYCSQHDTALRKWSFQLVHNDQLVSLDKTYSLVFPDGEFSLTVNDDVLECDCTEELSAKSGFIPCKIKVEDGDEVLYSSLIFLNCEVQP